MTSAGVFRRLLSLTVASASVACTADAAPASAPIVVAASPSRAYDATIARVGVDAIGFARYEVTWKHGDDGGTASISSEIQQIASFTVLDDGRAVIVGTTSVPEVSAFHALALADAKTIVVNECYAPSASPGGRYVAYVRIHPQRRAAAGHASVARMCAEYRVMDLAGDRSAAPASYAIDLPRRAVAGQAHTLAMPIVWDDEATFHFGDRFAGRVSRVRVAMDNAGRPRTESSVPTDS